jgi:hypothetical protein
MLEQDDISAFRIFDWRLCHHLSLTRLFFRPAVFSLSPRFVQDIHFFLPGVFTTNQWPGIVNFRLWTVPYELLCYTLLTALVFLGGLRRKILIHSVRLL